MAAATEISCGNPTWMNDFRWSRKLALREGQQIRIFEIGAFSHLT